MNRIFGLSGVFLEKAEVVSNKTAIKKHTIFFSRI
jgi:hypothetical protein